MNLKPSLLAAGLIFLLGISVSAPVQAQHDRFDSQRMDRDLQIMERILLDLQGNTARASGNTYGGMASKVRGSYFPGYGVVFQMDGLAANVNALLHGTGFGNALFTTREDAQLQEEQADESKMRRLDSLITSHYDFIRVVIYDFFTNYVYGISQLQPSESISVLISHQGTSYPFVTVGQNMRLETNVLNPIMAEVSVADIESFRKRNISESEFQSLILFEEIDPNSQDQKELRVIQGIFDTVLRRNSENMFGSTRETAGIMLNNFGAMLNVDISIASQGYVYRTSAEVWKSDPSIMKVEDKNGVTTLYKKDGSTVQLPSGKKAAMPDNNPLFTGRSNSELLTMSQEGLKAELENLVNQVRSLVVDYGRTLNSLSDNDRILINLNLNSLQHISFPSRIEIQVDMATLREYDFGKISREEVLQEVKIREYK